MMHDPRSMTHEAPDNWLGRDGLPVTDNDKIRELNANFDHIRSQLSQVLADAVQMGVSENFVRIVLTDMVASVGQPDKPSASH